MIDLEVLYDLATDAAEGPYLTREGDGGWEQHRWSWEKWFARLGHPRANGACTACGRGAGCALKGFADLVAVTAAKALCDRLGIAIVDPALLTVCVRCGKDVCSRCGECAGQGCWDCRCDREDLEDDDDDEPWGRDED